MGAALGQLSKTEGPIAIGVEHARSFREQNAHAADANKVAVQRGNSFGAHPSNKNHHNYDYNNNNNIHHQQQHQHVRHNGNHGRRDKVALEISAMANSGASSGTNRSSTESLTLPSITAHHSTEAKTKDADELVSTSSGSSTRSLKNGPALSPPASTPPSNPATPKTQQPYVGNTETKKRSLKPITNWQKGELIGQGAFGRVYLGMNADSGELIAIKEVSFVGKISNIQEQLASLQREIEVLKQLEHHNIVRYLGVERVQNSLNIFLEYVPGGSIASLLSKFGSLSESVVKKYTRQILQGLMYLHEHRIIHRDIKGANVLVDVNGTIKLTDFGASKQIAEIMTVSDGFKSLQGTPFWMAPEVIMQTGHGRSADIWSVGCTVLEMFTGKPPWSECTTQLNALFHIAHTNELPAMPSHLSANAKDFLCQCFERNPKRRPSASQLLNHPFLAEDAPSSTRHNVVLERLPPPSSAALHTQQSSSANSTDDTGGNGQPNFNSHNGEPPSPVNISLESIQVGSSTIFNSNRGSGTFVDTSLRSQKTDEWFTGLVSHQNNTKIDSNRMPHDDNKSSKPKSARRRDGKPKPEAIKTSQPAGSEHTENANAYNPVEEPVMSDDDGAPPALTNKIDIIESRLQKLPASGELERLIGDATVSNMPNTTANSSLISISNNNDNDPEGARLRDEELELSISRFLRSSRRDSLKLMTNEMLEAFRRLAKDADDDNFLYDDNDNAGMSKDAADDDDGNNNGNNNGASHDRGRQKHPRRRRERKGSGTERDRETSLEQQQQIVKSKSSRRRKKAEEGVIRDDTINDDPVSNGCTNFNSNSNNNNNVARGRATSMSPIEPQAFSQQRNNAQRIAATTTATIAPATTTLGAAVSAGPSHNFIASAAIAGSKARSLYPIRTDHNRIQSFDDNDDDDTVMHDDMSSPIVLEVPPPPLYQKWDRLQRSDYGGAYGLRVDSPSRNNTPSSPLYGVSAAAAAAAATTTTSQPINSGIDNGGATTSWRLSPSPGNRQRPTTATTTTTNPTNTTQSSSTFRAKKIDWS